MCTHCGKDKLFIILFIYYCSEKMYLCVLMWIFWSELFHGYPKLSPLTMLGNCQQCWSFCVLVFLAVYNGEVPGTNSNVIHILLPICFASKFESKGEFEIMIRIYVGPYSMHPSFMYSLRTILFIWPPLYQP